MLWPTDTKLTEHLHEHRRRLKLCAANWDTRTRMGNSVSARNSARPQQNTRAYARVTGLSTSRMTHHHFISPPISLTWNSLQKVRCSGTEHRVLDCSTSDWGSAVRCNRTSGTFEDPRLRHPPPDMCTRTCNDRPPSRPIYTQLQRVCAALSVQTQSLLRWSSLR